MIKKKKSTYLYHHLYVNCVDYEILNAQILSLFHPLDFNLVMNCKRNVFD